MRKQLLVGGLMVACTLAIIWAGRSKAQEIGMPVDMTGFLCDKEDDVRAFLDKMRPDMSFDEAKEVAKGTSCTFTQSAGIIKSMDGRYVNRLGSTFAIIAVTAEEKTLYTWRLLKTAAPA